MPPGKQVPGLAVQLAILPGFRAEERARVSGFEWGLRPPEEGLLGVVTSDPPKGVKIREEVHKWGRRATDPQY